MRNFYSDNKIIEVIENITEGSYDREVDAEGIHYSGYDAVGDIVQINLVEKDGVRYLEMGIDGNVLTEGQIIDLFSSI